jgi:hypothetical protein
MITRGFQGRRSQSESKRLPPGQHLTGDFPVLSAGPTPHTPLDAWTFALEAEMVRRSCRGAGRSFVRLVRRKSRSIFTV